MTEAELSRLGRRCSGCRESCSKAGLGSVEGQGTTEPRKVKLLVKLERRDDDSVRAEEYECTQKKAEDADARKGVFHDC